MVCTYAGARVRSVSFPGACLFRSRLEKLGPERGVQLCPVLCSCGQADRECWSSPPRSNPAAGPPALFSVQEPRPATPVWQFRRSCTSSHRERREIGAGRCCFQQRLLHYIEARNTTPAVLHLYRVVAMNWRCGICMQLRGHHNTLFFFFQYLNS